MKKQVYNPYLPSYEYIPDGEPYVFDDRLYVYGSHDRFNGSTYCENDYVCWSAPVSDLSDWTYEGIIFRKADHPEDAVHQRTCLYAPDVTKGPDGRYYLYYSMSGSSIMSVASAIHPPAIMSIMVMYPIRTADPQASPVVSICSSTRRSLSMMMGASICIPALLRRLTRIRQAGSSPAATSASSSPTC